MQKFISTRGDKTEKRAAEAIIQGLADDRGLYVPMELPTLKVDINSLKGRSYQEIAYIVMRLFFDDYTDEELKQCIKSAYDSKFSNEKIAPLVKVGDNYVLELYYGATSAFKDMALSILPYLLTTALEKENEKKEIVILTATSGDTGKAALAGFADVAGTKIIVFYPKNGVSEIQELQMTTQNGGNVEVFAIEGNFDDAQTGVKGVFNDTDLGIALAKKGYKLSSANSINIGRLVPQVAYYVSAYVQLLERGDIESGDAINICVPTGNFGNILAAYYAKQLGIPIAKLVCASNQNDVLTEFLNTGVYDANREFFLTSSPSMDILISSNLERLLYHLSGGNADEINQYMRDLEKYKKYEVSESIKKKMSEFNAYSVDSNEVSSTIKEMFEKYNYLMDTHTAVAQSAYIKYERETGDKTKTIIVSTASPYKFSDSVGDSLGINISGNGFTQMKKLRDMTKVSIPEGLETLEGKKRRFDAVIGSDEIKKAVEKALE